MVTSVPQKVNAKNLDTPTPIDRRRVTDLLPAINKTDIIKKFFAGVADHAFQPEQSEKLAGYIGRTTSYTNYDTEFYLGEPSSERQIYQLEPTTISRNADTNDVTDALFYNDLANLIRLQGGLSENHDRLFGTESYSWAPPVDLDMLMNFINYFWDDDATEPEYIVMESGAQNANPWSTGNKWKHLNELDPGMTMAEITLAQAERPIICFHKDLELFNYGLNDLGTLSVKDDVTTDPRTQLNGQSSITIDGYTIQDGDTVVMTNVSETLTGATYASANTNELVFNNTGPGGVGTILDINTGFSFVNQGFYPGATIEIQGSNNEDGIYVIDSFDMMDRRIILTEPLSAPSTAPQPAGVSITENDSVFLRNVYQFREEGGVFSLYPVNTDLNDGDTISVQNGSVYGNTTIYYDAVLENWVLAQAKSSRNQAPLFQLYDSQGTKLQDSGNYPGSTFTGGSKLFSYQVNTDPRQPTDAVLGIPLVFDNQGDIVYENHLVTERFSFNIPQEEILGFYYHKTDNGETVEYSNDWYLKSTPTRQRISDRFIASDDDVKTFTLSLPPEPIDSVQVFVNEVRKNDVTGNSWTVTGNQIEFDQFFETTDRLRISYLSDQDLSTDAPGKYEIPDNLEANPDNLEVNFISNSQWFEHFSTVISNQAGFEGAAMGVNNYHEITDKDLSLGEKILQHRAPMLKTMMLGANQDLDFMKSVRYVANEYTRFRNKLIRKLDLFIKDGIHFDTQTPLSWLEDAIREINIGKVESFPFAFSGMFKLPTGDNPFLNPYMPSSPSRLGVYPVYRPQKYFDLTYVGSNSSGQTTTFSREVIQFHDGSIMIAFGDFRDDVLLEMENRIYADIPDEYKQVDVRPDFDWIDYVESAFREGDYSRSELNQLLLPIVQRWAIDKGFDPFKNTTYEQSNPFTYNYSSQGLPGYWRGIYKWFLDTDRPNTHPWEMFGFSQKPVGWESVYGFAPYTNNPTTTDSNEQKHLLVWQDMETGLDRFRTNTVNEKYARPGLTPPVDASGNLLNPIAWGVATDPGVNGSDDWKIGDHAPVESIFRRSERWPFAVAQISYLMKPVRFIELGWEPALQLYRYSDGSNPQWVNTQTDDRMRHSEYQVHNELNDDGTRYLSDGINQWISDYVTSTGKDITTTFGNKIRGLEAVLGHRGAGFINQDATRVFTDNFGLFPSENLNILTYLNPCVREEVYSGVIIQRVAGGWEVQGYDVLDPIFKIIPSIKSGRKTSVDIGSINVVEYLQFENYVDEVPYGTVFGTQQDVYSFLISYGKYLKSRGWIFDEVDQSTNSVNDWRLAGKQFLFWSLGDWTDGSLISVSPLALQAKFSTQQGTVLNIERIVNGVYGLLNRAGGIIDPRDTFVSRFEDEISIVPEEFEAIFSARIIVAEYEHIMLFDNQTIFNDLVYDPLLKLRQARLRLSTTRAGDWKGRIDAPGYIIQNDTILPNFDKMVSDFSRYFNIEDPVEQPILQEPARKLINYQERAYFSDLLVSEISQIQFYQGFIRTKGTKTVVDRLLRSTDAVNVDALTIYEEWALRVGEFGGVQDFNQAEFFLKKDEWIQQPQLVEFRGSSLAQPLLSDDLVIYLNDVAQLPDSGFVIVDQERIRYDEKNSVNKSLIINDIEFRRVNGAPVVDYEIGTPVGLDDDKLDDIITIANNDPRWNIKPPMNGNTNFPVRNYGTARRDVNAHYVYPGDVKRIGYPKDSESTVRVQSIDERNEIDFTQRDWIDGDSIVVDNIQNHYDFDDPRSVFNNGFMSFRFSNYIKVADIKTNWLDFVTDPDDFEDLKNKLLIVTDGDHNLTDGDLVVFQNLDQIEMENAVSTINNLGLVIDTDSLISSDNQFLIDLPEILSDIDDFEINFGKIILEANDSSVVIESVEYEAGRIITSQNLKELGFIEGRRIRISGTDSQDGEYTINCYETTNIPNDTLLLIQSLPSTVEVGTIENITIEQSDLLFENRTIIEAVGDQSFGDITASHIRIDGSTDNDGTYEIVSIDDKQIIIKEELPGLIGYDYNVIITFSNSYGFRDASMFIFTENRYKRFYDLENFTMPNGDLIDRRDGEYVFVDTRNDPSDQFPRWAAYRYREDLFVANGTQEEFVLSRELKPGETLVMKACERDDSLPGFTINGTDLIFSEPPRAGWDVEYFDPWNTSTWNSTPWNGSIKGCNWDTTDWDADTLIMVACYSQPWDEMRVQSDQIDTQLFRKSLLYNNETKVIDLYMNIWDPVKGLFPGQLLNEIEYRTEYNPANYNETDLFYGQYRPSDQELGLNPLMAWGEEQVGTLWWDVSKSEYVDYENGTNRERRDNWGRLAQGRAVRIYEWVRSPVAPAQWADYVAENAGQPGESFSNNKPSGTALADSDGFYRYSTTVTRNIDTGANVTSYYFWVTDKESVPDVANRSMSVGQLQRKMTNPTLEGVPWWAPINRNAVIISGIGNLLTGEDSIFQMNYNIVDNSNDAHRQWTLSRENDPSDVPSDRYWNKMVDSLVGFDRLNQIVPDPNLEEGRRYGNFIRPRQTWFRDNKQAGKIFIDKLNEFMASECVVDTRIGIIDLISTTSAEPTLYAGGFTTIGGVRVYPSNRAPNQYDRHVSSITERDALIDKGHYEQVWVDASISTGNFFKVYQYQPNGSWIEVFSQTFKLDDFWTLKPYFEEGYDETTLPAITVESILERNSITQSKLFDGLVVEVLDANSDGSYIAALYKYDSTLADPWFLISKDDCIVEFDRELFFDSSYGSADLSTGFTGAQLAFKSLIDVLRTEILTDLEENQIMYAMIRYVHSEQSVVDWAYKTSFVLIRGFNEQARQDPIQRKSQTDSFIEFFQEAKPYHTKLRDFVTDVSLGTDIYNANVTDFDKPVHYDFDADQYRVLDDKKVADREIMNNADSLQNSWFNNYIENPELIRTIDTKIVFDRIGCNIDGGWDSTGGWDNSANAQWDMSMDDSLSTSAANRIWKYYAPQPLTTAEALAGNVDLEKNISELIPGCKYRGVTVDGRLEVTNGLQFVDKFLADGVKTRFTLSRDLLEGEIVEIKICGEIVPMTTSASTWNQDPWNSGPWNSSDSTIWYLDGRDIVFNIAPNSDLSQYQNSWDAPNCEWDTELWDGDLEIVACVIAVGVIDLNDLDTLINPETGDNSFSDISNTLNEYSTIIDGHLFRQPDYDSDHGEEQILSVMGESISIKVGNAQSPGAPKMITRNYSSQGIGGIYDVGQLPASKDSVFVFVNGVRVDQQNFELESDMITVDSDVVDDIVIVSFGQGGAVIKDSMQIFMGNGLSTTFTLTGNAPASPTSVFIVVGGQVQTYLVDYTISGSVISFITVPGNGAEIIVCLFENENFTRIFTNEFTATLTPTNVFAIGQNLASINPTNPLDQDQPSKLPTPSFVDNAFVEINGARQIGYDPANPTNDFDYLIDYSAINHQLIVTAKLKLALVNGLNPGDQFLISDGNPTTAQTVTVTGTTIASLMSDVMAVLNPGLNLTATYDDVDNNSINIINVVGGRVEIENITGTPLQSTFGYTNNNEVNYSVLSESDIVSITTFSNDFVIFPKVYDGTPMTFTVDIAHDLVGESQVEISLNGSFLPDTTYMVNTTQNQIDINVDLVSGLAINDVFEIYVYYVGTEVFEGNTTSEYNLGQKQIDSKLAIVYYNGLRQDFNVDYSFNAEGDKIIFNNAHDDSDTVIITGFTGRQNAEGVAFRMFLDNVSATNYSRTVKPVAGTRVSETFNGTELKVNYTTGFGYGSTPTTKKIVVIDSAGQFSASTWDMMMDNYGTIDGNDFNVEIMEYDNVELTGDSCLILNIVSRTGTRTINENDIVLVLDERADYLPNWKAYRISDEHKVHLTQPLSLGDTEIHIDRVAGLPKQKPNERKMEIPGVVWIEGERIEFYERDGTTLKQIRRATGGTSVGIPAEYDENGDLVSDWRTVTDFVYLTDTVVTDGSKRQEIPGGYRFDATGFGLQYTNSLMGRFLQDKPGSC